MRGVVVGTAAAAMSLVLAGCHADPQAVGGRSSGDSAGTAAAAPSGPTTPTPTHTSWGPSLEAWDQAGAIVAQMSTADRAGQVLVATYPGPDPPVDLVAELGLGGVILMTDNVPTGPDAAAEMRAITDRLAAANDRPYPLVVGVDQEGGPVARLGAAVTELPPGMAHGAADDPALSERVAVQLGSELRGLGVTMVFAPVADVTVGPSDPTIAVRSPGDRPDLVSRTVRAQVSGFLAAGVTPVLKHFPGHGSVAADSHTELPVQPADRATLQARDLVPFAEAVDAGAPAVMVAHIDVRDVDPGVPSSVSEPVVTGMLRSDLGFEGLVVTDSLLMAGVADLYPGAEGAVAALAAGSDLLLMPQDARAARDAIVAAVEQGRLPAERLAQAARRVVALQLHRAGVEPGPGAPAGTAAAAGDLASASVTLVSGPCQGPLVDGGVRVSGGTETDRARFTAAAQRAGLPTGSGSLVTLLGSPGSAGSGDVVVTLDTPHGLAASQAGTARLAVFGRTPETFDALVAVLTGSARAAGSLPVTVEGLAQQSC